MFIYYLVLFDFVFYLFIILIYVFACCIIDASSKT